REGPNRSAGEGDDYERMLDECVKAWNESDPPTSKSLAAISVSRRKHCDAALKAGVPAEFLIEVIRREAPRAPNPGRSGRWPCRNSATSDRGRWARRNRTAFPTPVPMSLWTRMKYRSSPN